MEEFAPIKDKFDLGNWIRVCADDEIYRLRLVSYEISGKSLSNINTEFSELTKTACGVNDVRSILSKAQSMATSMPYIAKQAEQGKKAQESIVNALDEGLNSALVNIKNNDNEEVIIDNHGILCRSWDDESQDYNPEMLRVTKNIICLTDDAFRSVKTAIGKHDYYYFDENQILQKRTGFGVGSEFMQAGYSWGSQIIGGEIYSENYSNDKDNPKGTYFNLNDGTFSLGGGKIKYNGETLSLSDVILKWEDIENANDYVTTITENTVTTEYVNALDVVAKSVEAENITGNTFSGKTIVLGGENNGDGSIVVKNADGDIILTIDKNGIQVKDGAFNYMSTEELIILSGSVLSNYTSQIGFTVTSKSLFSECVSYATVEGTVPAIAVTRTCKIENIDLTNYNKITITSICETGNEYGTSYVNFGIDSASNEFYSYPNFTHYEERTTIKTLDVSEYTGIHSLVFYQYTKSDSSYSQVRSYANIGLTSIVLHN